MATVREGVMRTRAPEAGRKGETERVACALHTVPLYDPKMERIKA